MGSLRCRGAWKSDSRPRSPVLCPGVQSSLQVNVPWPLQECSQIPAPLGPQSSHLTNGYNHPHPTQLIKADRAESTLERKTQRPHYTNGEDCYWSQERDQREKPRRGGVSAQRCALGPLGKRSRSWAGRTAPTGSRGAQLCYESATYPGDSVSSPEQRGRQSLPGSLQGPRCGLRESGCGRALHSAKRSAHAQANYRPGAPPAGPWGVETVSVGNKNIV